jgi:hypothetical protein
MLLYHRNDVYLEICKDSAGIWLKILFLFHIFVWFRAFSDSVAESLSSASENVIVLQKKRLDSLTLHAKYSKKQVPEDKSF